MTGGSTVSTYDAAGQLKTVTAPGETSSKSYDYFDTGELKRYTDETGAHTDYLYDAAGRETKVTDALGRPTSYTYRLTGEVETVTQPGSGSSCTSSPKLNCITSTYDDAGRVTGVDYSDSTTPDVTDVRYDGRGARFQQTTGGVTETWKWNKRGELTEHVDANGDTTGYRWDKRGHVDRITYPGQTTPVERTFDADGNLLTVKDWAGRTTTFGYDDDANPTSTAFAGGANTDLYTYDGVGQMLTATWKQGTTTLGAETYTRPAATKAMIDETTPSGAAGTVHLDNSYDGRDRLTATSTETFAYDAVSNLTTTSAGVRQSFDAAQQLCRTSQTAPSACGAAGDDATAFTYDARGNRTSIIGEDEQRRSLTYDQVNRLTSVVDDTAGTIIPTSAMGDRPLVGDYDHDDQDDILDYRPGGSNDDLVWWGTSRANFGHATDSYNVTGDFTALTGDFDGDGYGDILWYKPGTGADYVWFWFGRYNGGHDSHLTTIDATDYTPFTGDFDGDHKTDIYWYRAGSGTDVIWFGDANADEDNHTYVQDNENVSGDYRPVTGDFNHDGIDEIFWYAPGTAADVIWYFTSRTTHTSDSRTVNGANYLPTSGDFDGDGNDDIVWNDWTVAGGDTIWWGPGVSSTSSKSVSIAAAQFLSAGDFDGDGNDDLFLNKYTASGDTLWWGTNKTDFSTTPVGFTSNATLTATYRYDADSIRAGKTVNNTTTTYTYSAGDGLAQLLRQRTGTSNTYLLYGPDGTAFEQINPDSTVAWLHHDQLGSTRLATNAAGATVATARYQAYGTPVVTTGTQPLLGYAGQYADAETGYQYLRARYYDPSTSQFLTKDPLAAATRSPYTYGWDQPVGSTDPSGLAPNGSRGGRRKLTAREVELIEEELGESVEEIKTGGSGKGAGRLDLYVEEDGTVVIVSKGGQGEGEEIGVNLPDLKQAAHDATYLTTPSTYDLISGSDGYSNSGWLAEPWQYSTAESAGLACGSLLLVGLLLLAF